MWDAMIFQVNKPHCAERPVYFMSQLLYAFWRVIFCYFLHAHLAEVHYWYRRLHGHAYM